MTGGAVARATAGLSAGVFLFAMLTCARAPFGSRGAISAAGLPEARADDARPSSAAAAGCILRGTGPVGKGTQLFDQPSGGRVIANFTGAVVPIALSGLPVDPTLGRAHVVTSTGAASLRIDGYGAASSYPTYTTRDLPVAAGHVWIASAQRVRLVQASSATLTAELTVLGSAGQTVRGSGGCDAFSLQRGAPTALDVPGNGRLYSSKAATLELYDQPGGSVIFTLRMTEGTSQLFWSTEARGGFVHVVQRADVVVDAWAKAAVLEPLKRGEMVDQVAAPQSVVAGAQLALDGSSPPRLVVATREIPVRARRDEKERPIGAVEIGAEVYVMETVAGWANLLPKSLGFTPGPDGGFWIPANDVPRR